ncbi:hypothetical protein L226DRAFT_115302 [Lentinus tigrinus ALCF2SS1-7]|uniref:uncharacterized protein n=1 Tax=Lentinus tigrinus ALCF2SS1-7 TaxID=1328758 RepID=UPI001165CCDD|nr:hypothetical protein L226DRAFT_115302 [Lentinus tigrinus ALCF2SS1-7]
MNEQERRGGRTLEVRMRAEVGYPSRDRAWVDRDQEWVARPQRQAAGNFADVVSSSPFRRRRPQSSSRSLSPFAAVVAHYSRPSLQTAGWLECPLSDSATKATSAAVRRRVPGCASINRRTFAAHSLPSPNVHCPYCPLASLGDEKTVRRSTYTGSCSPYDGAPDDVSTVVPGRKF